MGAAAMALEPVRHVHEEDLERYAKGNLPEDAVAWIEEHLLICDPCRTRLSETDAYVAAMRKAAAHDREARAKREKPAVKTRGV
jgi:anti-sigma factor RsiW